MRRSSSGGVIVDRVSDLVADSLHESPPVEALVFPVPGLRFVPDRSAGLAQILRIQVSAQSRSCGDHRSQQPARSNPLRFNVSGTG
jgi:hypothetical protein